MTGARATTTRSSERRRPALARVVLVLLAVAVAGCTAEADPSPGTTTSAQQQQVADPTDVATSKDGELAMYFLDVGQGDATLLISPDATVLVDAGRHDRSDVVPHLQTRGVDTLDLVIITHPHADHIGQFDQIITTLDVAEVWWSGAVHTTATFDRALTALEESDAAYEEPRAGDTTTIGGLRLEVVNPPETADFADLHDSGLALRVTYGNVAVLFTGDIEEPTEQRMLAHHPDLLAADIYHVGHHGSHTSTSQPFLDTVDPIVAVYSAHAGNTYGHPHTQVLQRLTRTGVDVYGTDIHGTVTITTDGDAWTITTDNNQPALSAAATAHPNNTAVPADETGCVDINAATTEQLQQIIHIGPERATQLIALRPFHDLNQLTQIDGIGPARLADIHHQGLACVT